MNGAILQLRDLASQASVRDEADVVIIGSGAAGATSARVLSEAGLETLY